MITGKSQIVMGIDPSGYDGSTYAYCVMKTDYENDPPQTIVIECGIMRDKEEFNKTIQKLKEQYQIDSIYEQT